LVGISKDMISQWQGPVISMERTQVSVVGQFDRDSSLAR
jgi:hypothetical protein